MLAPAVFFVRISTLYFTANALYPDKKQQASTTKNYG
ncbi:hypothetical protein L1278_000379 [Pontibacter sp. HSC-36F09]|nr:hypothetical protein [Pontibacter sp. HSC-36F09]